MVVVVFHTVRRPAPVVVAASDGRCAVACAVPFACIPGSVRVCGGSVVFVSLAGFVVCVVCLDSGGCIVVCSVAFACAPCCGDAVAAALVVVLAGLAVVDREVRPEVSVVCLAGSLLICLVGSVVVTAGRCVVVLVWAVVFGVGAFCVWL